MQRHILALPPKRAALPPERAQQLAALTDVNTADLLGALGWQHVRRGRRLLRWLCRGPAQRFARQVIAYDDLVGSAGLQAGGAWAVQHFVERLQVQGRQRVPASGPVLIVANHPGLCDTMALFAAIRRRDLWIIAADRPFLRALPHTSRHLLFVDETNTSRFSALRSVTRHLRAGGAVLTFPGGQIEPDPAVLPGASAALDRWSHSVELLARLAPHAQIVPALVSGVLSSAALQHPLTHLRRKPVDRQWLAALLQIQLRALQHVTVHVVFGPPIHPADHAGAESAVTSEAVKTAMRRLIAQVLPA